ncbi:MAG: outer membrane protein assembly factor BamA [Desulfobacterales bacterium]|nr:outer membrane protein assembly factor BamA [Desulfobacterales bacterium]MDD4072918.1 outer membrane protein assembly factor BamA [Desulfobacterales bacterium]MDD4392179.1 outer membrane protein assembly factor BamA [Desulfobacterales bacterium]
MHRLGKLMWVGLITGMMLWFLPGISHAQDSVRVIVLPFDIHAKEDLSYLRKDIPDVLKQQLEQEGAIVIDIDPAAVLPAGEKSEHYEEIRKICQRAGADYIVWGSFIRVGNTFSLGAGMLDTVTEAPPVAFYAEGTGIETLFGKVKELASQVGKTLFKRETVFKLRVEGNKRIEADAILRKVKIQPGDIYRAGQISEDLKTVYAMGYFDDIRVELEKAPEGNIVIFRVTEKPTLRAVRIKGNRIFDTEKIKENLNVKTGAIINEVRIRQDVDRIEQFYKDKNYHNVQVAYTLYPQDNNQSDLEYNIEEGQKLRIRQIVFSGNEAYSDNELKKIIKTSEEGFFSWLTSAGDFKKEDLSQDVEKLTAFYTNSGYIQARIGEPRVDFNPDGIVITLKIEEGSQYEVGKVDIEGELVLPKEQLMQKLSIKKEKFYNREALRNDILALTDIYSDEGYAYADIVPRVSQDSEKRIVDIVYTVQKNNQVYFEQILISGNTKTRDKVIRRELQVYEQELYSGKRLKRGVRNLYRLDYFEDIKVDTVKGSADDKMILKLGVTEKPTGMFSFGGGYSSVENVFIVGSIAQRNLFGRGQTLQLKAELGSSTDQYTLSFTEPWLFDIPLSAGVDLYKWTREYDDYDKDSTGAAVRFGYPVFDYTKAYLSYSFEIADITDIVDDASVTIQELEGKNTTSSISASIRYDSRDRVFNPTEGSDHSFTVEHAGGILGGDIAFTKYLAETGWYWPLFWDTVGFVHGKGGYVQSSSGGILPDYEKFYLGGINSVRGYDWQDIHALDDNGDEIGGTKFIQFNIEYLIPLIKKAGLMGLVFFDAGNVYNDEESVDFAGLHKSIGYGFRWYSPMGPIRIEYGYMLDPVEGEESGGRWEFTMGSAF